MPAALSALSAQSHAQSQNESTYHEFSAIRILIYDFVLWTLSRIFDCFFREIRPRNGFKIPSEGPVIFVGAPHANQFVDPIILMNQIKQRVNRRISFLIAAKSLKRKVIGFLARCQLSIGVNRAQDNMKRATGKIFIKDMENDPTRIHGIGTKFTQECMVKGLIGLPNSLGNVDIKEIISDNELVVRKEFNLKKSSKVAKLLTESTEFKVADKIDQKYVYEQVFEHLAHDGCIGIFPEGGSHDRTTLLPLKAGVAIMALGAMAHKPGLNVKIVPCGMNYFHPHKFRSRAVIEFGSPIEIPADLVEKYSNPETNRDVVKSLLDIIQDGLKAVTVQCDNYETLMVVQASRRLYQANFAQRLPLPLIHEFNRRIIQGYEHYKDNERVIQIKEKVLKYNKLLKYYHLPDHLVENAEINVIRNFFILIYRSIKILCLSILALPGTVLFSPVFISARIISKKKAKEALAGSVVKIKARDVLATWKILISMVFAPLLYIFYSTIITVYCYKKQYFANRSLILIFIASYLASASVTYAALIVGEQGMDIFKSLTPLYLSIVDPISLNNLKIERRELAAEITEVIDELGVKLYPDDFNLLELGSKKKPAVDKSGNTIFIKEEEEEDRKTAELRQRRKQKKAQQQREKQQEMATASGSTTLPVVATEADEFSDASHKSTASSYVDSDGISRMNSNNSLSNIPVFSSYQTRERTSSLSSASSNTPMSIHDQEAKQTAASEQKEALKNKIREQMHNKID